MKTYEIHAVGKEWRNNKSVEYKYTERTHR